MSWDLVLDVIAGTLLVLGSFLSFVAGLGKAEESGTSANAVLRELGITGQREADALLRLSGNAEGLAEALGTSAEGFADKSIILKHRFTILRTFNQGTNF